MEFIMKETFLKLRPELFKTTGICWEQIFYIPKNESSATDS